MLNDITIYRDIPVLAGMMLIPPTGTTEVLSGVVSTQATGTLLPADAQTMGLTAQDIIIGQGCSESTGRKQGRQRLIRLPGLHPGEWYTTDPLAGL